jgi:hypothetical protein
MQLNQAIQQPLPITHALIEIGQQPPPDDVLMAAPEEWRSHLIKE